MNSIFFFDKLFGIPTIILPGEIKKVIGWILSRME
jgi:hypothetical protein